MLDRRVFSLIEWLSGVCRACVGCVVAWVWELICVDLGREMDPLKISLQIVCT
jgi:hypothetical protein